MSRSTRKTPIFGSTNATSEKSDKQEWNKRFRRIVKILIAKQQDTPVKKEAVSDVWAGSKDGKRYWKGSSKRDMRK